MRNNIVKLALPLFLLWPLGSFLLALRNIHLRSSAIVIMLFSALFGYSFTFTDTSADSYRIAYVFSVYDFSTFDRIIQSYQSGQITDLYNFLAFSLTKWFTSNPKVLFAFCGLVFGFFMCLSLRILSEQKFGRKSVYFTLLFLFFFSLNPITNINGFRFWTAGWFCFYSLATYFIYNKRWSLFLCLLIPFFHFSFFICFLPILLYAVLSKFRIKNKILFIIYTITLFAGILLDSNALSFEFILKNLSFNSSIDKKIDLYTGNLVTEQILERNKTLFHTVNNFFNYVLRLYFFILIIRLKSILKIVNDQVSLKLYKFVLIFGITANIISIVPSGHRFLIIFYLLVLLLATRLFVLKDDFGMRQLIIFGLPVFSFMISFNIGYLAISLTSTSLWYTNVFWIIYEGIGYRVDYFI